MESFATPYPVLFYDGEQEHDKGHVGLHSVLTFKRFQALVAQKTGIPANQLSAVFVCRRTLKDTEKRQKLPINDNTNFNIILNQHNPSRERDCHFLVSMKKSKKERKGGSTRKRSAEAENADDDDSTSSRGDLSPSDERPKVGSVDETFSPEATSPRSFLERPSSPTLKPASINGNGQKTSSNGSPNGKLPLGVVEYKVERTLLRREGAGQNGFASPRSSSGGTGGATGQRVEGFSVNSSAAAVAKGEVHTVAQAANASTQQLDDRRKADKHWRQSSPVLDDNGTLRQNEKAANGHVHPAAGQPTSLNNHSSTRSDLFNQDRFNDSISQAHVMRPPSAVMARGNGVPVGSSTTAAGLQRHSSMLSFSNGSRPTTPSISSAATTAGNFIPRVSVGSGAAVGNATGGLTLQQAQAHITHMQQLHQSSLTGSMTPLELSKLNGMLRGLVARDNRGENAKVCKLCCILREKNSGPPPFHWCVDDTITKGFRGPSPAGPIGRPVKRHVEAAA
ncbi:unnamed protein product [Calypogeia fissa]